MNHLTLRAFRHQSTLVVIILGLLMAVPAMAQVQQFTNHGTYGVTGFRVNGQLVASRFNYQVLSGANTGSSFAAFTSFSNGCYMSLGGNISINPFNTNATVTVTDLSNGSNTETVALTAVTSAPPACTLTLSTNNSHSGGYVLSSGSCGLKEALNYLGSAAGTILVNQEFYDQGCTQSTITGLTLANGLQGNQYVHDISNGQDVLYGVQPTTASLISAPSAPTIASATGGALTSGTYYGKAAYVDPVGGISAASTDSTQSGTVTGLTMTAPAASTGAVGWLPYVSAAAGDGTGTEIVVVPTSTVCKLTTLETIIPACAMAANATILANPSATAKVVAESTAHTTFAYQPLTNGLIEPANSTAGVWQTQFLPFVATATLNNSNADAAQFYVPPGYFNYLGRSWDVCLKGATATQVATAVLVEKLQMATQYGQTPITVSTITYPTQTQAAAGTQNGCWTITTGTTGASGKFWSSSPAAWTNALNSAPGTQVASMDVTTGQSSAIDLTKGVYVSVNLSETTGANITGPIVNLLTIKPITGR